MPTAPKHTPQSKLARNLKFALGLGLGLTLATALALTYWAERTWRNLPAVDSLAQYRPALPLRIYSADGDLLAEYGEERREFVPLARIPPRMRQALLAIEDARFYEHGAVDFTGLLRATLANIVSGHHVQGASTITMQVARDFFLTRDKTLQRKLTEILLSYKLERHYGKDKLLELYMNQIYLGERSYGFSAAASIYFDKTLDQLSVAEAAMLAGLPKAPSAYNPVANPQRAQLRQQYILQRMLALGYLTQPAYDKAVTEKLLLSSSRHPSVRAAAYAVEEARQLVLLSYPEIAYTAGLDVTTTIRMDAQVAADKYLRSGLMAAQGRRGYRGPEAALALPAGDLAGRAGKLLVPYPDSAELRAAVVSAVTPLHLEAVLRDGAAIRIGRVDPRIAAGWAKLPAKGKRAIGVGSVVRAYQDQEQGWMLGQLPEMEGALVSLDAASGDILAVAGGFDFTRNHYNHAMQAYRQPGSSFKPFVYSAALEKGYFPGTYVDDTQRLLQPSETGARAWRPRNYANNYEGFITVRRGLMRSKNIVAVSLMQAAGAGYVQRFATRFGFEAGRNPASLPLALGAGAVTPLQLAQSYGAFANGGYRLAPKLIKEIRDRHGAVLYAAAPASEARPRIISARNAYLMDSMLRDVVAGGTGRGARVLGRADTAGKTGTSNDAYDAWFAGYSSGVVSVVWLGYDQPKSMGSGTGGTLALPIWSNYMQVALNDRPELARAEPDGLAVADGDFVYAEYLQGDCLEDGNAFIQSELKCAGAAVAEPYGEPNGKPDGEALERERILKLFSTEE
ncbi:PBP1A family penicillin-binding protein [Janthinobacterium sp.]|uniref:penicillin-binding protein 1A n=1 Tax=Janthinobacterium sp. TaxID=1871054 RepID=UPI00293D606D|nr:PBP1A family penicillin-binding protein [Janthinobacterium sp.]